jgi:hypothetical protein
MPHLAHAGTCYIDGLVRVGDKGFDYVSNCFLQSLQEGILGIINSTGLVHKQTVSKLGRAEVFTCDNLCVVTHLLLSGQ